MSRLWRNPGPVLGIAVCLAGWLAVLAVGGVFSQSVRTGLNDEYDQIAINLVEHGTYSANLNEWQNETVTRGPGYPLYLAGIFQVFGVANYTAVRLLDFVLHGLTTCLIGILLMRWAGPLAGWIGAALFAFWPTTFYYVGKGSSETLLTLFTAVGVAVYFAHRERPTWASAAGIGIAFGFACLTRGSAVVPAAIVGVALLADAFSRTIPWRTVLIVLLAGTLTLLPWWIRNYSVAGSFVPFHTLAWYNAYHDDVFDSLLAYLRDQDRERVDIGTLDPAALPPPVVSHPPELTYPPALPAPEDVAQEKVYREIMLEKFQDPTYLAGKISRNAIDFWSVAASPFKTQVLGWTSLLWFTLFLIGAGLAWRVPHYRRPVLLTIGILLGTWTLYLPFLAIFRHTLPVAPYLAMTIALGWSTLPLWNRLTPPSSD